ncbi:MAG: metal ABC transporter permease [Verrucomicrobiales bacterium]|nr:metal ABC transporter permease [Verrucomicrobiales bacterium]
MAAASSTEPNAGGRRWFLQASATITDRSLAWPTAEQWSRVLRLQDYNTRVVVLGTTLLGLAAGVVGSFTLLRKRALMGDALSHAMLPGIGLAFMISVAAGGTGKSLPVLLTGATLSGLLGLGTVLAVRHYTRLKEDTALGIVLSVYFGAGVAVLGVVQRMGEGHSAGLESFIYGKAASLVAADTAVIGLASVLVIGVSALLFKEFRLLCFDASYAATQGWPVVRLDLVMMSLVVVVTVIGLQAVGLVLIIALIIPAAAARFWTGAIGCAGTWIAAGMGAASCAIGAAASALLPNLPSGAMIVLVSTGLFLLSLLWGRERGVILRWQRRRALNRKVRRQHVLRAVYEWSEAAAASQPGTLALTVPSVPLPALLARRSWSARELRRELDRAAKDGLLEWRADHTVALTKSGLTEATRVVRNHRLWEVFLITYADIAPSHVDRDADAIEHVLGTDLVAELESLLARQTALPAVPLSPHTIAGVPASGSNSS